METIAVEKDRFSHHSHKLKFSYLFDHRFSKLEIKKSEINGIGTFIAQSLRKGEIICPLFGILFNIKKSKQPAPYFAFQVSDDHGIETVNEATYINHCCDPNTKVDENWMIVALKDLQKGDELTLDYGTLDYWDYSFPCMCMEKNCRKTYYGKICENAPYRKENYEKFSPYLKEKFAR